jgi:hypothetical protein
MTCVGSFNGFASGITGTVRSVIRSNAVGSGNAVSVASAGRLSGLVFAPNVIQTATPSVAHVTRSAQRQLDLFPHHALQAQFGCAKVTWA